MTSDALEIIDGMIGNDPAMRAMIEEEEEKQRVARIVYDARTAAGLTQSELAARVGTRQSSIARLEDADYDGPLLTMLARIAQALDRRVEVRLVARHSATGGVA